jgi:hypothetical protein
MGSQELIWYEFKDAMDWRLLEKASIITKNQLVNEFFIGS